MNLLINTSNLNRGGALQVAHSFLSEIKKNKEHTFHVVLSTKIVSQIDENLFPSNFVFYHYPPNPIFLKLLVRRAGFLSNLEKKILPDFVFTVFGPTYWRPSSKHIVGFADGWCFNPGSPVFKQISYFSRLKKIVLIRFKNYRIKCESDILIVETDDARNRISKVLRIPSSKIIVIGNTFNDVYNLKEPNYFNLTSKSEDAFRLVTISANYPQKNLQIIKQVIPLLKCKGLRVHFYLTIDDGDFQRLYKGCLNFVTNLGPIDVKYGPSVYKQCDALFLPTLLETFSSSYPEAMKMRKPILTSDLSFARNICGDAAEYFNPLDPEDIVAKIEKLVNNPEYRDYLIKQGEKRLELFETPKSRAEKYLEIFEDLISQNESTHK